MIITRLSGGMGNQMFQYALGRHLSLKYKVPLEFDIEIYKNRSKRLLNNNFAFRKYDLDVYNIPGEIAKSDEIPFLNRMFIGGKLMLIIDAIRRRIFFFKGKEKHFYFDHNILSLGPDLYLDGLWQSYKYFTDIDNVIRKDFTLKNKPAQNILDLANEINTNNSLCIHIRRGDYVGNKMHDVVKMDYYSKGLEYIKNNAGIDKIYVFSDDIEWCKKNIKFEFPTMFVGMEYVGEKDSGHMLLMSVCKYFIIPNSSFSWWGAWLSTREGKIVIAPKLWFADESIDTTDLIPDNWIRI